ncbi:MULTISPECIES: hypothetical protein [Candidatus Williamhamiltonella]|uniref:hypothetical protein n=1 Tax=Candidatus Williamhamiltonella TaxID=568987 RepID=UPI001F3B6CAB|nr:hypothetical protein [Candidatus Hamiltonella defensa]
MTLNPFIYNPQQALAAGQSGFITDSGAYVVTITDARFRVQPSRRDCWKSNVPSQ